MNTGDCSPAPPTSPDAGEIQCGNSAGTVIPVVESVGVIKLPPFWKQNARLWFVQIEAQFQCSRISSDNTRYYHLISALDADIMTEVSDVLVQPSEVNKYEHLKEIIIKRFTESPDRQLQRALLELDLGDKKPSQLLRQMTTLADGRASADALRVRWLSQLPQHVQRSLKLLRSATLEAQAALADDLMEEESGSFVMAAGPSSAQFRGNTREYPPAAGTSVVDDLKRDIAAIKASLTHLQNMQPSSHSCPADRNEQQLRSPRVCFYHAKFGPNARKCSSPCAWVPQQGN
ncbi:uncharacterized protein LOC122756652 [Drosophila santomea]|uniref:uncharacterized protein LOC122756560 n=1 Tax=Drosophila santomea TaxID=129105 RepID=UPI001CCA86FC|nr:uncharacterized protein LOC122756560 [Drosophila santomea]XP_043862606.1 uncharacterized protein LOC122756575 [Drosophila santomea]XP_043862804.1 uncharacterized protein LOC122756652 [Drosophila santomea]